MKKIVTIFTNYLHSVFMKLKLQNTSGFFEIAFEIKPATAITSSTRAMKMKFYDYLENFSRGELPVN